MKAFVLTPVFLPCTRTAAPPVYLRARSVALSAQRAGTSPLSWAASRARITHFKEAYCHTLMWRTAASATEISARPDWIFPLRWGRGAGVGGGVRRRRRARERESVRGLLIHIAVPTLIMSTLIKSLELIILVSTTAQC